MSEERDALLARYLRKKKEEGEKEKSVKMRKGTRGWIS